MTKTRYAVFLIFAVSAQFLLFSTGCESSEDSELFHWNDDSKLVVSDHAEGKTTGTNDTANAEQGQPSEHSAADNGSSTNTQNNVSSSTDKVSFSQLHFDYGGFKGETAKLDRPRIRSMKISGDTLTFKYDVDLSCWGLSHTDPGALCCLFVKENDGVWRGGKFDWISSSRTSRILENVFDGYNGWTLSRAPNPCQAAMVIVDRNGRKRSNVITGTWRR